MPNFTLKLAKIVHICMEYVSIVNKLSCKSKKKYNFIVLKNRLI